MTSVLFLHVSPGNLKGGHFSLSYKKLYRSIGSLQKMVPCRTTHNLRTWIPDNQSGQCMKRCWSKFQVVVDQRNST